MCFDNIVINNWIRTTRQIRVIVAIELRDVEDLLIVTDFKAIEIVEYSVVFTFNIFKVRSKLLKY